MFQIWFVDIKGVVEGPFSKEELMLDPRITPDTLVWREGFESWVPARDVIELSGLFEKNPEQESEELEENNEADEEESIPVLDDELVLDYGEEPPHFILWLILVVILVVMAMAYLYFIFG